MRQDGKNMVESVEIEKIAFPITILRENYSKTVGKKKIENCIHFI